MQTLRRNRRKLFYANQVGGPEIIVDEWGNQTGEYDFPYSAPMELWANISAAKGAASEQEFGELLDYDKVIVVAGSPPFNEYARLWIDNLVDGAMPNGTDGKPIAFDYIVKRIATSLNFTSIAVKKVNVSQ